MLQSACHCMQISRAHYITALVVVTGGLLLNLFFFQTPWIGVPILLVYSLLVGMASIPKKSLPLSVNFRDISCGLLTLTAIWTMSSR